MSWEQRNADFCKAQTDAQMAYIEAEREVDRLETENARLLELTAILCHCMQIKASCDDCRISGHKGELARDPLCACDGLHRMLRELGIEGFEVDG